jgi:hypothetical protein
MRTTMRLMTPMAAVLLLVSACAGDDDDGAIADETNGTQEVEADDADDSDDADDGDDGDGDGEATATWDGEEYDFARVRCDEIVEDTFQIRASGPDAPDLQVRFGHDDAGDHDFDSISRVELFFNDGDTIGDGRLYTTAGGRGDADGVSSDGTRVGGEAQLEGDDSTQADPEGGLLEFEMVCP